MADKAAIDARTLKALRDAAKRLGAIQTDIVALSKRDDAAWRRDLIALRRQLQLEVAGVATLVAALGTHGDAFQPLRAAFGRMRSAVAFHQANWPAVAIDRDDSRYTASVRDVRAANRDFIAAVDRSLIHLEDHRS